MLYETSSGNQKIPVGMNQNANSESERNNLQPGWKNSWNPESSPIPDMRYLAGAPLDYDFSLPSPFVGSMGSSSGYDCNRWTPQDTLQDESLLGESVLAPQGLEGASSQSLSMYADTEEVSAAYGAAFRGITGFGQPSSQSTGPNGQILHGIGNEMTSLLDGLVELDSGEYENQGQGRYRTSKLCLSTC